MCDTLYKSFSPSEAVFAKNSDRDPDEPQVIEIAPPAIMADPSYLHPVREDYISNNFK